MRTDQRGMQRMVAFGVAPNVRGQRKPECASYSGLTARRKRRVRDRLRWTASPRLRRGVLRV